MIEKYITPEMEIIEFETEDVITTSTPESSEPENTDWPLIPLH